ncbi:TPA: META domain-containing protein [Pseudomonas aeruginosa]|uniref:META domain-containing protein n=5 Tax=Pseudomonas aeruginosa TaxID=287 RepID=A0A069QDZ4_PSEAI|nr:MULTISPECIES: META domain-containing protein [Pseudomonas]AID83659.1 lipoprotein [Pseudomonas aeruginosa VRFPA04]EQL41868.1 hypothetical protein M770_08265 [Pseudomonas aeruginosa VRFPA03]ETU85920.1 hypothetical protein Q053_03871 [Pseudomonas aeruginosa BWHPSA048]EVT87143.1 hypothetical protein Z046_22305 [Pseudomonas aeruginosa VRFPA09]KEA30606.1 hypothetical protein BH79_08655 [Pseudomonas aeruginosa C0324C]MDG0901926.1 META domain-containing protein [Pseudomonas sp. L01]SCX98235.1 MET
MKPSLALFASTALVLGGCASQETTLETEQAYQVDWVGAQPTMDYSHISLTFDGQGRAFGNGGCNHWFASYTLQDDLLQFGAIGSTRRLCAAEIMEQERRFLALLQSVQHWDISPSDELRLWPAEGKPLRLVPEHD